MSAVPDVSVVCPTRNRAARLANLLASLEAQTLEPARWEAIVVDDGSSDRTGAVLDVAARERPFELRPLRNRRRLGIAAARNRGWRAARGALIAFTDDDCEPEPSWLAALLAAGSAHPGAIVRGPTEPIERELPALGPLSRTLCVVEPGPYYETCNIAYPRELLDRVGGFDEAFAQAGEDTDLAWRALAAGAVEVWVADARMRHAVENLGPTGSLRLALRWSDAMRVLRLHPGMRRHLVHGLFWKRSHRDLLAAAAGIAGARRFPPALALAVPYARGLAVRAPHAGVDTLAWLVVHDAVETYATVRGAVRHRTMVI